VLFYSPEDKICLTGDTLFAGNCGRTDLPEGSNEAMCDSLVNKVAKLLAPDTRIYPGHGPDSTMGEELAHNPYLRKETWLRFNIGI
jgi:glyoxylase-like metal-dependent hydrolase (beta-lactamase superfamily II)